MKKSIVLSAFAALVMLWTSAEAAAPKRDNYVVFNIKGDCGEEDCIAAVKQVMHGLESWVVSMDVVQLAPHQTLDYKVVTITFVRLDGAPYDSVIRRLSSLGYNVVSYVIHDTHKGTDVIIPH